MDYLNQINSDTPKIRSPFDSDQNYCCVVTGSTEQYRRRQLVAMADTSLSPDTISWVITDGQDYSSEIAAYSGGYVNLNSEYRNLNPLHLIRNDEFYAHSLVVNSIVNYLSTIVKESAGASLDRDLLMIGLLINRFINRLY